MTTIETKRGDVLDWSFNLSGFSTYPGLFARASLKKVATAARTFRSINGASVAGETVAEFDINCYDLGNGTARIHAVIQGDVMRNIEPGEYVFDIEMTMTGWGPYSTPDITVIVTEDRT